MARNSRGGVGDMRMACNIMNETVESALEKLGVSAKIGVHFKLDSLNVVDDVFQQPSDTINPKDLTDFEMSINSVQPPTSKYPSSYK